MTNAWLTERDELLDRQDRLVDAWPKRKGETFQTGITSIAAAFEQLASNAQHAGADALEVSRTWRYAGMAWYELAASRELEWLQRAERAYQRAESHLDRDAEPVDAAKLDYCIGRSLLSRADGHDPTAASRAVQRFVAARDAARQFAPQLLPSIEADLSSAETVAGLMGQATQMDERIAVLRAQLKSDDNAREEPAARSTMPQDMFQILRQQFEAEKEKGSMSETRQDALDDIMASLGQLVDASGQNRSVTQMAMERQSLEGLMQRVQALKRTHDGGSDV